MKQRTTAIPGQREAKINTTTAAAETAAEAVKEAPQRY